MDRCSIVSSILGSLTRPLSTIFKSEMAKSGQVNQSPPLMASQSD